MRAALYLRVSTKRQAEKDLSIPDQRKQLEAFCKQRGWTVAAIGWQWDVIRGGLMGMTAPDALEDGRPIEGWVRVTQQLNAPAPQVLLGDGAHRPYAAADLRQPDARERAARVLTDQRRRY